MVGCFACLVNLDRRRKAQVPSFWADSSLSAELQINYYAGLRKHRHLHLGTFASVRSWCFVIFSPALTRFSVSLISFWSMEDRPISFGDSSSALWASWRSTPVWLRWLPCARLPYSFGVKLLKSILSGLRRQEVNITGYLNLLHPQYRNRWVFWLVGCHMSQGDGLFSLTMERMAMCYRMANLSC